MFRHALRLSYTSPDVFTSPAQATLAHTADATLVASSLYIIQLECFSSFFPLKSEVTFLEAAKSGGQHVKRMISSKKKSKLPY